MAGCLTSMRPMRGHSRPGRRHNRHRKTSPMGTATPASSTRAESRGGLGRPSRSRAFIAELCWQAAKINDACEQGSAVVWLAPSETCRTLTLEPKGEDDVDARILRSDCG